MPVHKITTGIRMKVILVDDHPIFSEGVSYILQDLIPEVVIINAASGESFMQLLSLHPDVDIIFLDYRLPDTDGLSLISTIKQNNIFSPIILVSGETDISIVFKAIALGINGFIPKSSTKQKYEKCLQYIDAGKTYLPNDIQAEVTHYKDTTLKEQEHILKSLNERQLEILVLMSKGYSNNEVAQSLQLSIHTIKSHTSYIFNAFNVDNRTQCSAEAIRLNII